MPAAIASPEQRCRLRSAGLLAAGWLLVGLVVVVALSDAGDPPGTVVTYLLVWLLAITVPGVLVWRALSRPTSIVQELGFGSVLGIALLVLAWVPATLLGHPALIWVWPIGAVVLFAVVPRLRRQWMSPRPPERRTPGRSHVAMMVVALLAFLRLWATALRPALLPPRHSRIFQDVWYELALTQRLHYSVGIDDPAVAGVPLHYHWFSNAFAAATQTLSGAPDPEVILHLWLVPMVFTFVLATAAAAERILQGGGTQTDVEASTRWWAGPLAGLLVAVLPVILNLGTPTLRIDNGFVVSSTSGILALCIILALVGPVLDLLHGQNVRGTWVVLGLLLLLSTGTKPSILPVVACGSALTTVVQWRQNRRIPRVAATLTLVSLLLIPLAALSVYGSTGGSRPQLFATLSLDRAMRQASGASVELPGHGGWLAPDLANAPAGVWGVAAGLLLLYTLTELPRLLGVLGVGHRAIRSDPGTWWCAGVVASGYAGLWTLAHPAYSQHYFWRIVIALGMVLTVTTAVRLLPPAGERGSGTELAGFGAAGLVTGAVLLRLHGHTPKSIPGRLLPYGVVLLVLVGLLLLWALLGRRTSRAGARRLPVFVLATCFCLATGLAGATGGFAGPVGAAFAGRPPHVGPTQRDVTSEEQSAALWLHGHSGPDDVVATNVFCAVPTYRIGCPHVAFWVTALTGRQLYVGPWAYTEKNLDAYAHEHLDYERTPSPWPGRVALSLEAVRSPSSRVMAKLRHGGVRWIFADRRATPVSPDLDRYAQLRFANADVRIYRLSD